jgi:hypothetical protein
MTGDDARADYREELVEIVNGLIRLATKVAVYRPELGALTDQPVTVSFNMAELKCLVYARCGQEGVEGADAVAVATIDAFSCDPHDADFGLSEIPLQPAEVSH